MLKLKYFKIIPEIIIFSSFFSLYPETVFAFFSPNTLQLLSASLSSGLGQAIAILIATIISLGIKIRRGKIKKILFILLSSGFFVCLILGVFHFYNVRRLNQIFPVDGEDLSIFSEYNEIPTNRFIDLNTVSQSEYDTFKKISFIGAQSIQLVGATTETSLFQLREMISKNQTEEYFKKYNINKEDKLLAYCNNGISSGIATYFLNEIGYNVYYTNLRQLENKDYIKFNHFSLNKKEIPTIVPFKKEKSDKYYIFFMFHKVENEFCDPEVYSVNTRDRLRKVVVWPEKSLEDKQCNIPQVEFERIFDKDSKIVCLNKLDCVLTQHYLGYLNLANQFKKVFFIKS